MGSGNRNLLIGGALLGCVAALPAYAVTDSTTGTFTTTNQSEWSAGGATVLNYTSPLLGPSFSASPSIGGTTGDSVFGYYGAEAGLSLSGSIGLQVNASLNSGSVNASVPFSATINAPNQITALQTSFTPTINLALSSSQLQVFAPTAEASVNLLASLTASGYAKICAVECTGTSGTIVNGSTSLSLLSINQGNNGQLQVLGQTVAGLSGSVGPLSYSVQGPQDTPNAIGGLGGSVSTSASTDVASLSFDAIAAIGDALDVPTSGSFGPFGWSLGSASVTLDGYLDQNFSLDPTVTADLYVPLTGQNDICTASGCGAIDVPVGFEGELEVDPTYLINASFSNDTGLDLQPGIDVGLLTAGVSGVGSIGPAFSYSDTFPTPEIGLYDNSFDLEGFTTIKGSSFDVQVVPEPTTLTLMGLALAGLGLVRRRRQS